MVQISNCTTNFNSFNSQRVNYQNRLINPNINDSVSFSGANANNNNEKKKKNLIAWIVGGIVLLAGAVILIKTRKNKILSSSTKNTGETIISGTPNEGLAEFNKKLAAQQAETAEIEKELAASRNNTSSGNVSKPESKHETPPSHVVTPKTQQPQSTSKPAATAVKPATIDEQANKAYNQYANKLAAELKMGEKEALIREVLPDLMFLKSNEDVLKAVLEHITPQNKDFVVKTAVPAILRNSEALDLGKSMNAVLKVVSPNTVDCLDKLATNAKRFQIKSQVDSINILRTLTKENKDFAFNDLFPYLVENMDKYKIRQSGIMGKFLEVVTPQNKDFVLNEALPTLLKNSDALNIDITDALKITKHLNKNNLKNIQAIADNAEKLGLKDADGFLIVDKFVAKLVNPQ